LHILTQRIDEGKMKVGDLVKYNHHAWPNWYGIVIKETPGTDENKQIMWFRDNNVRTSTPKRDLELISESSC
jgi:hypothetical protein